MSSRSSDSRFSRCVPSTLALMVVSGVSAVQAQTAAEIDWRPRSELTPEQSANLPSYCTGRYVPAGDGAESGMTGPDREQPIEASSLSARYELDTALVLEGDVRIRQGRFSVQGNQAYYDQASGSLSLDGPLQSRGKGFLLTGESARYDTQSGEMAINSATFLVHSNEMRGRASRLARPSESRLLIGDGELTTCAPDSEAWSVRASDIELDRAEGFGTARHVRLEVQDVPVFYWPWISFPIDDRRKTGFLYPSAGTSNTGSGAFVSVPYYLNLAPHYDATLTPQYIHGRGIFTEAEGRYLSDYGESVLQVGYIGKDRDYADENPTKSAERWGLDFTSGARLGEGWRAYADYSTVSDEDYLSDLNRSLDINTATHLRRRLGTRYQGQNQFLEAYVSGYQTLPERIAPVNRPYDQLPEILYGLDLNWGVPRLSMDAQYTYFDRDNESLTGLDRAIGHRLIAQPELGLDFRSVWGYAEPSVTLDHTLYRLDDVSGFDDRFSRTVPIYEWDSGLYFDRRASWFGFGFHQSLEPRLYYAYSNPDSQSHIPDFDTALKSFSFEQLFSPERFSGGDRVSDNNQLAAAVTTRFHDLETGIERARLSIGQLYYFEDREVSLNGQGADAETESPLAGEAVLRPIENLDIRASGLWDPDSGETEQGRSQLVYHSRDYRYLATLGHTFDDDRLEQSDVGAVFPVTDQVSLIGRWVYDSNNDRTVGTLAGLEYTDCCWSAQLVSQGYQTSDGRLDHRILFQIRLKGLGGGGGATDRVSDAIIGFDERERRRFR